MKFKCKLPLCIDRLYCRMHNIDVQAAFLAHTINTSTCLIFLTMFSFIVLPKDMGEDVPIRVNADVCRYPIGVVSVSTVNYNFTNWRESHSPTLLDTSAASTRACTSITSRTLVTLTVTSASGHHSTRRLTRLAFARTPSRSGVLLSPQRGTFSGCTLPNCISIHACVYCTICERIWWNSIDCLVDVTIRASL